MYLLKACGIKLDILFMTFLISGLLWSCSQQNGNMKSSKEMEREEVLESPTGRPLSPAMKRAYNFWPTMDDRDNEFFTNFKYSYITGIGKDEGVSRRDPSKIIKHEGKYYVWYTRRETKIDPVGMIDATDEIPAVDWDLAEIWYATSDDGFEWVEQGVAVPRAKKGMYGDRALTTTDILVFKDKYYLFYQTFTGPFSSKKGDHCDVSMAWADSPVGPWTKGTKPVIELGGRDEWDEGAIHDPHPLVYRGKIWLFYKGQPRKGGENNWLVRAQGVAIADDPMSPFVKSNLNPILNSGHETCIFPWDEGLVALLLVDGPEKNTVQYAADGIDFKMMASLNCPPISPGPYCPDVFSDNGDGKGFTWGLSHVTDHILLPINDAKNDRRIVSKKSFLIRFDCDLHRDLDLPYFKNSRDQTGRYSEETFFQPKMVLEEDAKQRALERLDL
ncbi:MAG: glycoside hydrolase [Reichenbachiella sp.]